MPRLADLVNQNRGPLAGYERTFGVLGVGIVFIIVGAIYGVATPPPSMYYGVVTAIIGIALMGWFIFKKYFLECRGGYGLSGIIEDVLHGDRVIMNFWHKGYREYGTKEKDKDITDDLARHINPEEEGNTKEYQKSLGVAKERNPKHHYVTCQAVIGNYSGPVDLIIQAPPANVFRHIDEYFILMGNYPRYSIKMEYFSGCFRGFRGRNVTTKLNILQSLLQKLHIKSYPASISVWTPVIYVVDSDLARKYPSAVQKAQVVTFEYTQTQATGILAFENKDLQAELADVYAQMDDDRRRHRKKLSHQYGEIPTIKPTSEQGVKSKVPSGAKFTVLIIFTVLFSSIITMYGVGYLTFGEQVPAVLREVDPDLVPQYIASGWKVVGQLANGKVVMKAPSTFQPSIPQPQAPPINATSVKK